MSLSNTPGFILRTVDYGDHHVIAHILGRDTGRVSAIAYGARSSKRRFAGALQPLRVVEATLKPPKTGDLYRLQQLDVTENFPGIDERITTITAAGYATELTRKIWREGMEADAVFELLRDCFRRLPNCPTDRAVLRLTHQFELGILQLCGTAFAIDGCSRCGKAPEAMDKLRFSRRGEGLICGQCRQRHDTVGVVTDETFAMLRHLADPDQPLPGHSLDAALAQAGRVMGNAIEQVVQKPLASREMLFELM